MRLIGSIALLATLAASVQGLIMSKKVSALSAVVPLVGGTASGVTSGTTVGTTVVGEVPVHIERRYRTIHVPAPDYSYAAVNPRSIYYTAVRPAVTQSVRVTTNIGCIGRSIGNLLAVKGAIGSGVSSSGPSIVETVFSTY